MNHQPVRSYSKKKKKSLTRLCLSSDFVSVLKMSVSLFLNLFFEV